MKIAVFTSNQPRHVSLIESLAQIADRVYAVQECNTIYPGRVADFFRRSEVMQRYFSRVIAAEQEVFGPPRFPRVPKCNVVQMSLKMGDLNLLPMDALGEALQADVYVVFGSSYIKGALCQHLVKHSAVNVHMGVSPQYRGSSCNFWAMYDGKPQYVGATLHLLTEGLDSGPMIRHALPKSVAADPFVLGMHAVRAAHGALIDYITHQDIQRCAPVQQDKSQLIRYTKNADFTDDVAREYLDRLPTPQEMKDALDGRDLGDYLRTYVG